MLTKEQILRWLDVNVETGIIIWKDHWRRSDVIGREAGSFCHGYRRIKLDGVEIFVHHIIWFIAKGEWPEVPYEIDHRDLNRQNNAISNLRLGSSSQNKANKPSNNSWGLKGIAYDPRYKNPWIAKIQINGVSKNLGSYPTPEEAHTVWYEAACDAFGEEFVRVA